MPAALGSSKYPLRSGIIGPTLTAGTFRYAGLDGEWWSSCATSTATHAHDLRLNTAAIPSDNGTRYVGRSLRCLSTVLDI